MRASHVVVASALAAGALAGCEPSAIASPSFQTDIMPILAANCVRCHGVEPLGGAPPEFRLDSFDNTVLRRGRSRFFVDDQVVFGAAAYATAIAARIENEEFPMPPRFLLEPWQIDTLVAWAAQPTRGELALATVCRSSRCATSAATPARSRSNTSSMIPTAIWWSASCAATTVRFAPSLLRSSPAVIESASTRRTPPDRSRSEPCSTTGPVRSPSRL